MKSDLPDSQTIIREFMTSNLIRISDHHQSFRIFDSYLSFQRSKNESDVLRPSKHNNNGKYDHASIWVRISQHLSVCHRKYRHTLFIPSFSSITVDLFCYSPHSTPGFLRKNISREKGVKHCYLHRYNFVTCCTSQTY